jgi:hypothetical protein
MKTERQYPLQWPEGWQRTQSPGKSQFSTGLEKATRGLLDEIRKLGGTLPVISSNGQYRSDGMPYARQSYIADSGVAVYFQRDGKPMVFACDSYWTLQDNIHAIAKTIEALRAIERHGSSNMMERAFTGFAALPAPIQAGVKRPWRDVLEYGNEPANEGRICRHYRILAKGLHPDRQGGDANKMAELNVARDEALVECGR